MEWFDFAIYGYFVVLIGRTFFPSSAPGVSLLSLLAVFGMGVATTLIGLLPGYDTLGIAPHDRRGKAAALLTKTAAAAFLGGTFAAAVISSVLWRMLPETRDRDIAQG